MWVTAEGAVALVVAMEAASARAAMAVPQPGVTEVTPEADQQEESVVAVTAMVRRVEGAAAAAVAKWEA